MVEHGGKKSFRDERIRFTERRVLEYDVSKVWKDADEDNDADFSYAMRSCDLEGTDGGHFTFNIEGMSGDLVVAQAEKAECSDEFINLIKNAQCWGVQWVRFNL